MYIMQTYVNIARLQEEGYGGVAETGFFFYWSGNSESELTFRQSTFMNKSREYGRHRHSMT